MSMSHFKLETSLQSKRTVWLGWLGNLDVPSEELLWSLRPPLQRCESSGPSPHPPPSPASPAIASKRSTWRDSSCRAKSCIAEVRGSHQESFFWLEKTVRSQFQIGYLSKRCNPLFTNIYIYMWDTKQFVEFKPLSLTREAIPGMILL